MKKIVLSALLSFLLFSDALHAVEEASQEVRDREHSVRDIVDESAKLESKDVSTVQDMKDIFEKGVVSGQLRILYSLYNNSDIANQYATAAGGQLRYELAKYKGFNAAIEFSTSYDVGFATGEDAQHNSEISSEDGRYTQLTQAYIDYEYDAISLRAGRQLIDTPLADSDDIRMIPNTFEAYIATYKQENLVLMGGLLRRWQGVDAGLSTTNPWSSVGEKGTCFGGAAYSSNFIDTALWYYDISKDENPSSATGNVANSSLYVDISLHTALASNYELHTSMQYLRQKESDDSAIESSIYGAMGELTIFEDFTISAAFNKSQKQDGKASFSGFGGGALYTNMDSMILDAITMDRGAQAAVAGFTYSYNDLKLMYAYGDFKGDANSLGAKEHIVEQNIGCEYTLQKELTLAAVYVKDRDKEHSYSNGGNWENVRVLLSYNF